MSPAHSARLVRGWGSFTTPAPIEGSTLLHFPSTNSAAHSPAKNDVARLATLLDDDVWAFTNCRVDASGFPVAEIDWFFYNSRTGCLMVSEWKRFKKPVAVATDAGQPWLLTDGTEAPNPVEQAIKQQYAVREVIRKSILPTYFPASAEARVAVSVYSPQLVDTTKSDRLRFGKLYGSLNELARTVQTLSSTAPLLVSDDGARLALARALCSLFRCSISSEVETKLRASQTMPPPSRAAVVQRTSEIHREIAKLHLELAELVSLPSPTASAPVPSPAGSPPATGTTRPTAAAAVQALSVVPANVPASVSDHQRMLTHLSPRLAAVNGSKERAAEALRQGWRAILADPVLHGPHGISMSLFGSVATPLIKPHHGSLQKLLGMQPRKWCISEAKQVGLKPRDVPGKPSNIQVR